VDQPVDQADVAITASKRLLANQTRAAARRRGRFIFVTNDFPAGHRIDELAMLFGWPKSKFLLARSRDPSPPRGICHGRVWESQQARHNQQLFTDHD
jgi:hypothetical protein